MSRMVPRGVVVAGLGKRCAAAVIDALPVVGIYALVYLAMALSPAPATILVVNIVGGVLVAGYGLYQWWAYGSRGAGLGAKAMGLSLVSLKDGEPIGWWRFFLREVVFSALMGTVVGGIALVVFMVIHERRQGWHDMVGGAVMVEPKEEPKQRPVAQPKKPTVSTVGLPPHLSSSFSPQPGTTQPGWEVFTPEPQQAPEWLPGVQADPVAQQAPYQQQPFPRHDTQEPGLGLGQALAPQEPGFGQAAVHHDPGFGQNGYAQPDPGHPPFQRPPAAQDPWAAQSQFPPANPGPEQWGQAQFPAPVESAQHQFSPVPQSARVEPASQRPPQEWIPLPTPSSTIEPSDPPKVRRREFGEVSDLEDVTRIANLPVDAARRGDEGWYVRLDDGREVELTLTVLLGRNPQKKPEDPPEVHLVPASGDGRMISRTHVLIGTDARGVFVVDRGSTNGTALVTEGGGLEPCPAHSHVRVREGQQVSYGDRWFTVLRRPVL